MQQINGSLVYWDSYDAYVEFQRNFAGRTQNTTNRRLKQGQYDEIFELLQRFECVEPNQSVLCLGCRNRIELDFFRSKGLQVDGLDLYPAEGVIECDMSKMHLHPYFQDKSYDLVLSLWSLEHCYDLEGLRIGLNQLCKQHFVAVTEFHARPALGIVRFILSVTGKSSGRGSSLCSLVFVCSEQYRKPPANFNAMNVLPSFCVERVYLRDFRRII